MIQKFWRCFSPIVLRLLREVKKPDPRSVNLGGNLDLGALRLRVKDRPGHNEDLRKSVNSFRGGCSLKLTSGTWGEKVGHLRRASQIPKPALFILEIWDRIRICIPRGESGLSLVSYDIPLHTKNSLLRHGSCSLAQERFHKYYEPDRHARWPDS